MNGSHTHTHVSVSYTHLDVYKRQVLHNTERSTSILVIPAHPSYNVCVRTYCCYFEMKDTYHVSTVEAIPDHTGRHTAFKARQFAQFLVDSRAPVIHSLLDTSSRM